MIDQRLLTASEVAERIGFSADWVLDRFEAGDVPGYRFGTEGRPGALPLDRLGGVLARPARRS